MGLRQTSRETGLTTRVLHNMLHGHTWPTLPTIARLEMSLEIEIWGGEHGGMPT